MTDFGLARRLEGGAGLTLTGAPMGTPSYMAPEQARGDKGAIGPATDVYALGAILYEVLTGRPPFRAETPTATLQQVVADEPVPPARLNPRVPRDLETICLKCLEKDPARRYPSAAALADDLRRFDRGEPIAARPAGWLERGAKWTRRRPTAAVLLAAGLLLAIALVGGSLWLVSQRAQQREAVEADLKESAALRDGARWQDARLALDRPEARLGWAGPDDLRRRVAQARRDLKLVVRLDAIRLKRVTGGELDFYKKRADREYAEAFREAGLGTADAPAGRLADNVTGSAVREALTAAVYDWAGPARADAAARTLVVGGGGGKPTRPGTNGARSRPGPRRVGRRAGVDGAGLDRAGGTRSRRASCWPSGSDFGRPAGTCRAVLEVGAAGAPGADFWPNLILGNAMLRTNPQEASGSTTVRPCSQAAPAAAVGYCAVGDALQLQHLPDQAADYYEKALRARPQLRAGPQQRRRRLLRDRGRLDEAIESGIR